MSTHAEDGGPVHVDTAVQNGHQVTVVRDAAGNIVYPSYVPPATQPPPPGPPLRTAVRPAEARPSRQEKLEAEHATDELSLDVHGPARRPPPPAAKQWATELPQSPQRRSTPGLMRRAGTDICAVGQAQTRTSSSSSSFYSDSSSDSEGEELGRGRRTKDADDYDRYRRFEVGNQHYRTQGKVSKRDGRLAISLHDTSNTGYLAKALGTAARKITHPSHAAEWTDPTLDATFNDVWQLLMSGLEK